ncbi:MAG TPA: hypothetical protein GXZ96_01885 [Firmicutes bacterium]|jgi:hypothetical protein|nr:hypothetical protein [Bacillota bacterium]
MNERFGGGASPESKLKDISNFITSDIEMMVFLISAGILHKEQEALVRA